MNKKILILFILSFLSLNTFSFWHEAEFVFEEHTHENEEDTCKIYLYCDKAKDNISDPTLSLQVNEYLNFVFFSEKVFLTSLKKYRLTSTRAPPQFS